MLLDSAAPKTFHGIKPNFPFTAESLRVTRQQFNKLITDRIMRIHTWLTRTLARSLGFRTRAVCPPDPDAPAANCMPPRESRNTWLRKRNHVRRCTVCVCVCVCVYVALTGHILKNYTRVSLCNRRYPTVVAFTIN